MDIPEGMETLKIRMDAHSANALSMAQWLEKQPNVLLCLARITT